MARSWTTLDADAAEREALPDLEAVLAAGGSLAAPPNRRREVRRLTIGDRSYFLKVFHRPQLKNRLRLRFAAPRANSEAELEAILAGALRARGITAPRPVGIGRDGPTAYFLCARLPGEALSERLARQGPHGALLRAAARFAGQVLAAGFRLPDLAPDHVFVEGPASAPTFAVLDLHNGTRGRPDRRTLRRVLRHSAGALRPLAVSGRSAIAAAVQLLRAAGRADMARPLLSAMAPWAPHERYDAPGKSDAYRVRNPQRAARELALLAKVWPGTGGQLALDSPCGAGRLWPFLRSRGCRVLGADRSRKMLTSRDTADPTHRVCADALGLPLADRSVDGVTVFRFLHHLEPKLARAAILEAARVADRWLVLTFFHPLSVHAATRRLRGLLRRRPRTRFCLWPATVARWVDLAGFDVERWAPEGRLRHELWVVSCRRRRDAVG